MAYCDMDAESPKSAASVADFVSGVLQKPVAGLTFGVIELRVECDRNKWGGRPVIHLAAKYFHRRHTDFEGLLCVFSSASL
jgi:hypothetical protein